MVGSAAAAAAGRRTCRRPAGDRRPGGPETGHGYENTHSGHNLIAGGYLALLSLFGMVMLHELLAQFEAGAAYEKRSSPKFGLRWFTWPSNTWCAAIAWRNYPPAEGTEATVLKAVANLDRVRGLKQAVRDEKIVARHRQALAAARRRDELQAAETGQGAGSTMVGGEEVTVPADVLAWVPGVFAEPVGAVVEVSTEPIAAEPAIPASASSRRRREAVGERRAERAPRHKS